MPKISSMTPTPGFKRLDKALMWESFNSGILNKNVFLESFFYTKVSYFKLVQYINNKVPKERKVTYYEELYLFSGCKFTKLGEQRMSVFDDSFLGMGHWWHPKQN